MKYRGWLATAARLRSTWKAISMGRWRAIVRCSAEGLSCGSCRADICACSPQKADVGTYVQQAHVIKHRFLSRRCGIHPYGGRHRSKG